MKFDCVNSGYSWLSKVKVSSYMEVSGFIGYLRVGIFSGSIY